METNETNTQTEAEKTQPEADAQDKKELDAIAQKHKVKTVFCIIVPRGDGTEAKAFFKKPDRMIYGAALSMQARNPLSAKEIVLRSCFLEGDQEIIDDDDLFFSACTVVEDMIVIRQANIKKN